MSCGDLIATSAISEFATNTDSTGLSMRTSCPWFTWIASECPEATLVVSCAAAPDISGPGATVSISNAIADAAPERRIFIVIIPLLAQSLCCHGLDHRLRRCGLAADDLDRVAAVRMHQLRHRPADFRIEGVGVAALRRGIRLGDVGIRLALRLARFGPGLRVGGCLLGEETRDRRSRGLAVRHAEAAQAES